MTADQAKAHLDPAAGEGGRGYVSGGDVKQAIDQVYADMGAIAPPTAGALDSLTDVDAANPDPGEVLTWSGTAWNAVTPVAPPSTYGDHLVTWNGTAWRYRGATVTARPSVPTYNDGARVVWNTSLHSNVTSPPALAVAGDIWIPHGEVVPT